MKLFAMAVFGALMVFSAVFADTRTSVTYQNQTYTLRPLVASTEKDCISGKVYTKFVEVNSKTNVMAYYYGIATSSGNKYVCICDPQIGEHQLLTQALDVGLSRNCWVSYGNSCENYLKRGYTTSWMWMGDRGYVEANWNQTGRY